MVIIAFDDTEKTAFNLSKELAIAQYTFNLSKELDIAQYSVHNICVLNFISDIIELKKTPR